MEVECRLENGGLTVELLLNTEVLLSGEGWCVEEGGEELEGSVWDEEESESGKDDKSEVEEVREG